MRAYSAIEWEKIAEASLPVQKVQHAPMPNAGESPIAEANFITDTTDSRVEITSAISFMVELEWESKFRVLLGSIDRRMFRM